MKTHPKASLFIGISGWSYANWKDFYGDIKPAHYLAFYAKSYATVEINSFFYRLPTEKTIKNWVAQTPLDFKFAIKASRSITHHKRLADCAEDLAIFHERIQHFGAKLGPILFQLPPSLQNNVGKLGHFLSLLNASFHYTFEFRHPSWFNEKVYALLHENQAALCISDLNGHLSPLITTGPFVYVRLHGPEEAYIGKYGEALIAWRKRIAEWLAKDLAVYCYFDNTKKGEALLDANDLISSLRKKLTTDSKTTKTPIF